jgi:opacity protein-like surface antigen
MSIFSGRLGLALGLAVALASPCLGGRTAHAQAAPVTYWTTNSLIGFGGNLAADPGSNAYGNFAAFDGSGVQAGGFSYLRYNFPNGWFVGSESSGRGLSMNGIGQNGAFGSPFYFEGVQFGYNFGSTGGLPVTVYAGFDTLKYNQGTGGPFASFDSKSTTLPGYSAHAGIEFQPASNVSLSLGFGYTQQFGRLDSDISSLALPGASPFAFGGRR